MTRRSRDMTLMDAAFAFSVRSTCSRASVGTVLALNGRIISTGYNGAPSGMEHCNHTCPCERGFERAPTFGEVPSHTEQCPMKPCTRAVHAEANAIVFSAKHGASTDGAFLYTTMAPCLECSKLIINAGIERVMFAKEYRDPRGIELLQIAGVSTHHLV